MKSPKATCLCLGIILSCSLFEISHCFKNKCGDDIIRGVNLGGWLLWEPWIVPTIFEEVNVGDLKNKVVDEWTYAQYIDQEISRVNHERYFTIQYIYIYIYIYIARHDTIKSKTKIY